MQSTKAIYDCLLNKMAMEQSRVESVVIGLTWTLVKTTAGFGLAMSPAEKSRTLPWAGTLKGKTVSDITPWIHSWNAFEASIALATMNSVLNNKPTLLQETTPLIGTLPGNLSVFEYFLPRIKNKRVVIIGRYPGIENIVMDCELSILERQMQSGDLPDAACEYVLDGADWIFISGSTLANKTFPRLAELSKNAITVLMGPSVPWLPELFDFGIDYIAGVRVMNEGALMDTVIEGGGIRIFDSAVQYCLYDLTAQQISKTKKDIATVVQQRLLIKEDMAQWTRQRNSRYPRLKELAALDEHLSQLDIRFKRLWDNSTCQI